MTPMLSLHILADPAPEPQAFLPWCHAYFARRGYDQTPAGRLMLELLAQPPPLACPVPSLSLLWKEGAWLTLPL